VGPEHEAEPEQVKETCCWTNGHVLRPHVISCEAQDLVVLESDVLSPPDRPWDPMSLEATCMHCNVAATRSLHSSATTPGLESPDFESICFSDVVPVADLGMSWGLYPPLVVETLVGDTRSSRVAPEEIPETVPMHETLPLELAQEEGPVQDAAADQAAPFVSLTRGSEVGSMAEGGHPYVPNFLRSTAGERAACNNTCHPAGAT
jgi:hypothetical protein